MSSRAPKFQRLTINDLGMSGAIDITKKKAAPEQIDTVTTVQLLAQSGCCGRCLLCLEWIKEIERRSLTTQPTTPSQTKPWALNTSASRQALFAAEF